ncbi:MAG: glycerate kinase, partial [Saprospiraceae bacterium]
MNVLIAPNSFRGSLDAFEVADIIGKAFEDVSRNFEITKIPIADGGDFTAEILVRNLEGYWKDVEVLNPLGQPTVARLGLTESGVGIVELSEASGTRLIKDAELNPMMTTTYGTGQLIKAALEEFCHKIIICLGGSATNDGGVGLLQALGVRFLDKDGKEIGFGGAELQRIATIDDSQIDSRVKKTEIVVPCDVGNYLLGEKGATQMFGPQKGATPKMVESLEEGMTHYSLKVWEQYRRDMVNLKHGGAAGGTAAGLWAFLKARLVLGSRYVLNELYFDLAAEKADLIITAEGKLDNQTINGKAPFEVAMRAKRFKKTIIAIAGQTPSTNVQLYHGVFSIMNKPMTLA